MDELEGKEDGDDEHEGDEEMVSGERQGSDGSLGGDVDGKQDSGGTQDEGGDQGDGMNMVSYGTHLQYKYDQHRRMLEASGHCVRVECLKKRGMSNYRTSHRRMLRYAGLCTDEGPPRCM